MTIVDRGPLAVRDRMVAGSYGDPLTVTERRVLAMLAEGLTAKEIAYALRCSHQTVRHHINDAKARIGAGTTIRAVVLADRARRQP